MAIDFNTIVNFFMANNAREDYLLALGVFIGLFLVFKVFTLYLVHILHKVSKKTKMTFDDVVIDFIKGIHWPFYAFLSFYIASNFLILPGFVNSGLRYILVLFIAYYAAKGITEIINHFFSSYVGKREKEESSESSSMVSVLHIIVKVVIWSVAFLMVLSNFGISITPLIASLGIGGIAIALAIQNLLGDLFSAFAIYFDKPFKEGDFIIVGSDMGVVKYIGIKTTRIQALGGQEIVISNSELMGTRINNYKKMEKRRVVFGFGVEYGTSLKKLKKINEIVKKIIEGIKEAKLDRVHFKEFGEFSLNYEVVYYVSTNDYNKYMDIQQEINFKIKEEFEKEKISMAFPTSTVYLERDK